jgi:hypothetical protein
MGRLKLHRLLQALLNTDETFAQLLKEMVLAVLSYHDTAGDEPEKLYHAFVLGLLTHGSLCHSF